MVHQIEHEGIHAFHDAAQKVIASQFNTRASPQLMQCQLHLTEDMAQVCAELIKKAHRDKSSKLTVKKNGMLIDENGHRVEAFAFRIGRFIVEQTLYVGIVVTMLSDEIYLLLIRSDVTADYCKLFPDIGTAQDWKVLHKCIDRFSPRESSHRYTVDIQKSLHAAAESAAVSCLEQSGTFNLRDLEILQNMTFSKLHMMDLGSVITLTHAFPNNLLPRLIHAIVTQNYGDLEEVQRVLRAWNFAIGEQSPGLEVPSIAVKGKHSFDLWQKSSRFAYIQYENAECVSCIFDSMAQAQALNEAPFSKQFLYTPVVVGNNIWSNRSCVEIDMRGLRFSDEELLVVRKYIATVFKSRDALMDEFARVWQQSVHGYNASIIPYPRLRYQSFHMAIGTTIFPASNGLLDYLELMRDADTSRLRLRSDRETRYAAAIKKIKAASLDTPWLYRLKPQTRAEALELLKAEYDAFLHQKDGKHVLAFTESSLIRCANLEQPELDDFVSKLKKNSLLSNKTYPVSFKNREQYRFICVQAESITITAADGRGEQA